MTHSFQTQQANPIASIIHDLPLALAIEESLTSALGCPFVHLAAGCDVWTVFNHSLETAIRDIEEHPRGKLFRRLLEYGPQNPDQTEAVQPDGRNVLSEREYGACVEFIFSHMVNRFKGELAELLALAPCIDLVERFKKNGRLPSTIQLYWGELIQERRQIKGRSGKSASRWGGFTKGADGLIVQEKTHRGKTPLESLCIYGIVEVKSMSRSSRRILDQIEKHVWRLQGGVRLGKKEWSWANPISQSNRLRRNKSSLVRILVTPANWKFSREWQSIKNEKGRAIVIQEPSEPPVKTEIKELAPSSWSITLAWSQEALEKAAYEMTFWYMSQVGKHLFTGKPAPSGWEGMSPEDMGYNAIKMMLYYIILHCTVKRQEALAIRLYNVYGFGYPLGVDGKKMLWPKNFPHPE